MKMPESPSRRAFLTALGAGAAAPLFAGIAHPSIPSIGDLRRDIVQSPVGVAQHRAEIFTRVFREHEGQPWIASKGLALREYFRTVPLYIRPNDRIAGSISETPGAMPDCFVRFAAPLGRFARHLETRSSRSPSGPDGPARCRGCHQVWRVDPVSERVRSTKRGY